MSSSLVDVLRDLGRAFDGLGVRWYLIGARAAALYGSHRLTADVDVTVLPGSCSSQEIVAALERSGIHMRVADADEFVRRTRVLPLVHTASTMPVDVVLGGAGLEQHFCDRARRIALGDLVVPVLRPDDLVVTKLLAGRPLDVEDAVAVLRAQGSLDLDEIDATVEAIAEGLGEDDIRRTWAAVRSRLARR
jgi:hypothetical protein